MRLEYFQLIDRVVELNLPDRKISAEAIVSTASTIFEGHFPGYPLMPGVLLIEPWRKPRAGLWSRSTGSNACRSWLR